MHRPAPLQPPPRALERASQARLAADIRAAAWELAAETTDRAVAEHAVPSLLAVGPLARLAGLPSLVAEIARALADGREPGQGVPPPLRERVQEHARDREALGCSTAEVVRELLLLRRTLERFLARRSPLGPHDAASTAPLSDTLDDLLAQCVAAYLDGVSADLRRRARLDALTGLLNRGGFADDLARELARAQRYASGLTLAYVDVDDFKQINDSLGHPEGDRVLRILARLLRETMRTSDLAARVGGDEFAAVLIEADAASGASFLARLDERVLDAVARGELPRGFGVSAGAAYFPGEAHDADGLVRLADERLYAGKAARRAAGGSTVARRAGAGL